MQTIEFNFLSFLKAAAFLLMLPLTFVACEKDDDDGPENEEELITSVILNFEDSQGMVSTFTAADPTGDGLTPDEIDEIILTANTTYTLTVEFLDESNPNDVEDITEEVEEESDEHLVCFVAVNDAPIPIITDTDKDGNPLGLTSTVTTGDAGTGSLLMSLKHEPTKDASDPCSTGETDVEVTFNVTVQ